MAATRTTQEKLLRRVYQPKMRKQFSVESVLLQLLQRRTQTVAEGEHISVPIHPGGSGGFGWSSATGTLPTAGYQQAERAVFNYARLYGHILVYASHIRSTKAQYAADARALDFETTNIVRDMRRALNFDLYGDGSGLLSTFGNQDIDDTAGVITIVLDDVRGITKGLHVALLKIADGTSTDGFAWGTVTGVSITTWPAATVTIDTAGVGLGNEANIEAAEANYAIYRALTSTQTCYGAAITGIGAALDTDNTYCGINRATVGNEWWRCQVKDGGTAVLDSYKLQEAIDLAQRSGGNPTLILMPPAIWTHIAKEIVDDRRYGERMMANGWIETIRWAGRTIVKDHQCPTTEVYCLDPTTCFLYQNDPGGWIDEDGNVLHRLESADQFQASWRWFLQFFCDRPAWNTKIYNLSAAYATAA